MKLGKGESNASESIYKSWKDLQPNDDREKVGEIWRGRNC